MPDHSPANGCGGDRSEHRIGKRSATCKEQGKETES
jgi:hypothetical protein